MRKIALMFSRRRLEWFYKGDSYEGSKTRLRKTVLGTESYHFMMEAAPLNSLHLEKVN